MIKTDDKLDSRMLKRFGENLRSIREEANLSRGGFARVLGIEAEEIFNLESGVAAPTRDFIEEVEMKFGVEKDRLGLAQDAPSPLWNGSKQGSRKITTTGDDADTLLLGYRSLSDEGKKKVLNMLRVFLLVEEGYGGVRKVTASSR